MEALLGKATEIFLSQGFVGAVCLLLSAAVMLLFRELRACERSRREDGQAMATALEAVSKTNGAVAAALENRTRATDGMAGNLAILTREVQHMQEDLRDFRRGP